MNQRVRVKICGITRLVDAKAAVNAGADAIGLVFYEQSPRAVNIPQAAEIASSLSPFITTVGLFVNATTDYIQQVLTDVPLGLLQFHGDEPEVFCQQFNKPYIKALRVREGMDINRIIGQYKSAAGILLDSYRPGIPGGTGETFNWQCIPAHPSKPIILAGGLSANNVAMAIQQVRPFAVDVSGGVEQAKGIKDPAKINAFIREVASVSTIQC
ncbi:phosphoribosylanthranilate isomerase [Endozoicomonas sp. SM1973]|uniref:N-(5'-phosphoribosyl)anthranilate isomerase n=1 Tax=Spartinivicinus marinus TaxID=2994442 RepID=A0A853IB82_9GAMM|nr:phosphoribosylanthranilate isomerase [Spartinivicinus marinus]MCX4024859.1 phosphoribosylanthranilate isomerase [Spartinivicinus marinus]NYZ66495.1 phosphoribosylanthranilate isomerase [Spartinivicinus marinus]